MEILKKNSILRFLDNTYSTYSIEVMSLNHN